MKKDKRTRHPSGGLNRRGAKILASIPKDLRPLARAAIDAGWELGSNAGHNHLKGPDGYKVPVPSCANNRLRVVFRNQLRDHGITLDG